MSYSAIPVIDFKQYGLLRDPSKVEDEELETLATELYNAFRNIGFAYLINHDIDDEKIKNVFKCSKDFFNLPEETKLKYAKPNNSASGWDPLCKESLNPERKERDLKELFDMKSFTDLKWPDEVQSFAELFTSFFDDCRQLTNRVLDALSLGLKLKDRNFLRECHSLIGQKGCMSCLRSLYYPELPKNGPKPGQIRCGEHSDYGTVTLLFQDNIGGLEVQDTDGVYVPATPIPGAVIVNIGDLMQRWTGDELRATKHRVVIPEEEFRKKQPRQSIAFFVNPNDNVEIKCLDGSDKYPIISTDDYLNLKFDVSYSTTPLVSM